MLKLKALLAAALIAGLAACGGGGGSAGTPATGGSGSGGGIGGGSSAAQAKLTVSITDSTGAATNSLSGNGVATASAKLVNALGAPIAGAKITFTADETLVKLAPAATALTNATGVATVQLIPISLTAAGAGTVTATATVDEKVVTSESNIQLSAVNLTLTSLEVEKTPLPAFGTTPVSVMASANGAPVTLSPVQVTFTASCGKIEPASVGTNAAGKASTTYTADDARCSGSNVTITASATGAPAVSKTFGISAAVATNIQFVTADPTLIYLAGSVGATQSQVTFKVVDATGNPLQNQALQLSLVNSGPGVSLNVVGNTAPVTLSTNAAGVVSVPVFSGTVPTSVQVRAIAAGNPTLNATSNVLTVASGRPVQRAISVAFEKLSIEGFLLDGITSEVTVSLADRQGNPVPDGTEVNLVAQTGVLVPARCVVENGSSRCKVQIRSQGTRTGNGRVQVLAYVPGEEDFRDANFNNVYDPGEAFDDLGNAYRDDNYVDLTQSDGSVLSFLNGQYDLGEFSVPRGNGSAACPVAGFDGHVILNSRANTCDGQWGPVDVRKQGTIVFATSKASIVLSDQSKPTAGDFRAVISDQNNFGQNSMPTGSLLSAEKLSGSDECTVKKTAPGVVPNQLGPVEVTVILDKCGPGDRIGVTVETPSKAATTRGFTLQ